MLSKLALPLHQRPVAALDDEPRLHRRELALQRRLAEALADFALDVFAWSVRCIRGPGRGPARA